MPCLFAALLQADVNVKQVQGLRAGVKKRVNIEQLASGLNKAVRRHIIANNSATCFLHEHEAPRDVRHCAVAV